jgi:hypothetical protein
VTEARTEAETVEGPGGPTCRRCGGNRWRVERRPKARLRWLLEMAIALPEVLIFQDESPGWPSRESQFWTCLGCGRRVRL